MVEQTGINNRFLKTLGWIEAGDNRNSPRTETSSIASEDTLMSMRESLLLARKDAEVFISQVFGSNDKAWVDRCSSIISDGRRG